MNKKDKFELICNLTTDFLNLKQGSLSEKTRKKNILIPRMVASLVGILSADIHPKIISDVLKRDRSTIIYYRSSHKYNFATFPKYRELFLSIYNVYNEINNCRLFFKDRNDLEMYLIESNIVSEKKQQVEIKIISGKISKSVKTSYLSCDKLIKNIKESLKNYNYSIEIKSL